MLDRLGRLIAPFERADGPPPATLGAFFAWCLGGVVAVRCGVAFAACLPLAGIMPRS